MTIKDFAFGDLSTFDASQIEKSLISRHTLVVNADSLALDVATKAENADAHLIMVTDDTGTVSGLLPPAYWKKTVTVDQNVKSPTLPDAFQEMIKAWSAENADSYYEDLDFGRIHVFWCERGQHITDEKPCSIHGG